MKTRKNLSTHKLKNLIHGKKPPQKNKKTATKSPETHKNSQKEPHASKKSTRGALNSYITLLNKSLIESTSKSSIKTSSLSKITLWLSGT